jgi:hypothetical protein
MPKPTSIIAQVAGSGTAAIALEVAVTLASIVPLPRMR